MFDQKKPHRTKHEKIKDLSGNKNDIEKAKEKVELQRQRQ